MNDAAQRKSTLGDLHDWTACGWLLSVMRAPVGTGIYSCTVRQYRQGEHAVLHGNANANNCTSSYSLENSCATLAANGLHHSLYHMLEIVHGSSVEEVDSDQFLLSVFWKVVSYSSYIAHIIGCCESRLGTLRFGGIGKDTAPTAVLETSQALSMEGFCSQLFH